MLFGGKKIKKEVNPVDISTKLSGELQYTIDAKGRMSFPQCFKDVIGDGFMLTRGANHRLVAYNVDVWRALSDKISAMNEGRQKEVLKQIYIKGAIAVESDKLGRILVPQTLREYAGLIKDVYVVGSDDVVEIWDKATYETYMLSISDEELYAALEAMK